MKEAALNYAGSEFLIGDIRKTISILETLLQKDPIILGNAVGRGAYYVKVIRKKDLNSLRNFEKGI